MHHNVFHVYLNERLFILYTIYFFISAESRKYARRSKSLSPAVVKQHIKTKERKDLSHLPPISQSVDSVDFWKKVFIFNTIISLSSLFQELFPFFFLITDETSSFCRLFAFSLIFSPFSSYLFILFRYLCGVIARNEGHSWPKSRRWHYILKGVTDACFWTSELPQIETEQKQCRWLPRGVVYTLRSVLRGYLYPHAHFTGVLYSPTWVFLCRVFL